MGDLRHKSVFSCDFLKKFFLLKFCFHFQVRWFLNKDSPTSSFCPKETQVGENQYRLSIERWALQMYRKRIRCGYLHRRRHCPVSRTTGEIKIVAWLLGRPQQVDQAALSQKATENTRTADPRGTCPSDAKHKNPLPTLRFYSSAGLWLLFYFLNSLFVLVHRLKQFNESLHMR